MADTSKAAAEQTGSSKLELPTHKRGSSVTIKPTPGADLPAEANLAANPGNVSLTDQPTAISRQPPMDSRRSTTTTRLMAKQLVGKQLLHFQIEEFVGGGGMGAVFRGKDTSLRRTVAIKVLSQDHVDEEMIRRFRHEAESAARLDHSGIPHVYYVGEDDGWYFIAFEFIEGKNIRDCVAEQGPLSIPQAISHLADIADAIQHASNREVVHRDIKPSNVLVTNEGRAHLVDMGLARSEKMQSTANELTATGVTLGTFDYISPEQAKDPRNVDTRSDIYSLGCTLYFILTGQPPFPDGTMLQKLLSHSSESPPDPRQFRNDIPPRMTEMLARMLAKDPNHRQQSAGELLGDILLLAEEQNVPISSGQTKVVIQRPIIQEDIGFRRHIPWVVPLLVLVGTVIGLQLWQVEPSVPSQLIPQEIESSSELSANGASTPSIDSGPAGTNANALRSIEANPTDRMPAPDRSDEADTMLLRESGSSSDGFSSDVGETSSIDEEGTTEDDMGFPMPTDSGI